MAVRNIATTDTLETFRTEFNAEAINFGDIATLNASLSATTIVGSVNEIYTTAIVGKNGGTNFHPHSYQVLQSLLQKVFHTSMKKAISLY